MNTGHLEADDARDYAERKVLGYLNPAIELHVKLCAECAARLSVELSIARRLRDFVRAG